MRRHRDRIEEERIKRKEEERKRLEKGFRSKLGPLSPFLATLGVDLNREIPDGETLSLRSNPGLLFPELNFPDPEQGNTSGGWVPAGPRLMAIYKIIGTSWDEELPPLPEGETVYSLAKFAKEYKAAVKGVERAYSEMVRSPFKFVKERALLEKIEQGWFRKFQEKELLLQELLKKYLPEKVGVVEEGEVEGDVWYRVVDTGQTITQEVWCPPSEDEYRPGGWYKEASKVTKNRPAQEGMTTVQVQALRESLEGVYDVKEAMETLNRDRKDKVEGLLAHLPERASLAEREGKERLTEAVESWKALKTS